MEKEFAKKNFSPLDPWTVQAELCWVGHRIQPPVAGRSFLVNKVDRQQSRPSWLPLAIASGSLVRVSSQVLLWTHPNSWKRTTSSQRCCSLGTWCWVALPSLASAVATSSAEVFSLFLGLAQVQHPASQLRPPLIWWVVEQVNDSETKVGYEPWVFRL